MSVKTLYLVIIITFSGLIYSGHLNVLCAQSKQHYFNSIGIDEGLSQSLVHSIAQDTLGFIWLGTSDGLNRFDGARISIFKSIPGDSTSLQNNLIVDLLVDSKGRFWVASSKGIDMYNHEYENFKRIKLHSTNQSNAPRKILEAPDNGLYILSNRSVSLYNLQNKDESLIYQTNKYLFSGFQILNDSIIVISAANKLLMLNILSSKIKEIREFKGIITNLDMCESSIIISSSNMAYFLDKFTLKTKKQFSVADGTLPDNFVNHSYLHKNKLYMATINGLAIFDTLSRQTEIISANPLLKNQLLSPQIRKVFVDEQENIWLGQVGGISWYSPKYEIFQHILPGINNNAELNASGTELKVIWDILETKNGNLLVATSRHGLYMSKNNRIENLEVQNFQNNILKSSAIYSLAEDSTGLIYIGADDGLFRFDSKNKKIKLIIQVQETGTITQLNFDNKQNLWIGATKGVFLYNSVSQEIKKISLSNKEEIGVISKLLMEEEKMLISGNNGIYALNLKKFYANNENAFLEPFYPESTSEIDIIVDIYIDKNNQYWFVGQGGLFYLDTTKNSIVPKASLGIEQVFFYAILEDTTGILWISSGKGIYSYNPKTEKLSYYNEENGMLNLEFNSNSKYIDKNGQIYFGGMNGIIYFNPYNIPENKTRPKVYIHKFKLYNNEITLKDKSNILSKAILLTKELKLNYKQNFFSIEFSSPEFYQHKKLIYAYRLKGLEKNWHITKSNENFAQYTNLPPGEYTLLIKAQNSEGYWTDPPEQILINIEPPIWKEKWFLAIVILMSISGIVFLILYRENQLINDKKILELKIRQRTIEIEKAQKELEIEKHFSESIIAKAIDGILVLDSQNNFTVVNKAMTEILGYTKEEIIQSGYFKLIPPKWIQQEKLIFDKVRNGESVFAEKEFYHSTGRLIPVEVSTNLFMLDKDDYIVTIIRDISKRKKLEIQLQEYNQQLETTVNERTKELLKAKDLAERADKLKTEFLANLSHEVRTPMNAINGFAQLLGMEHTSIEQKKRFVDLILDNSQKLLRLIEDIVDLSKFETGQISLDYTEFKLYHFLKEIYDEYSSYINLAFKDLKLELSPDCEKNLVIKSDTTRLKQSILHLLENAVKYTESGTIKIGYEMVGQKIMIYIEDQGIGIPADNLKNIFNVFEKPDFNKNKIYRGLGIGLALVKSNTELLSCSLVVNSEVGKGTRVEIYHPADHAYINKTQKQEFDKINLSTKKFLIVEDEEMNFEVLSKILKSKGAEINWASNGQIAVDKINSATYDAVIMDLKMPIMDGIQATKIIKRKYPNLPIMILSAFNETEMIKSAYKAGANYVMSKPFRINTLLSNILDILK